MTGLSGRKAEAARNDGAILDAARTVFIRTPEAPMSAVAAEAGVGVGALYRRYAGKEQLLQTLCADGLRRFAGVAEAALAETGDPWAAFAGYVRGIVESDVHALTVRLAGTFTPTAELHELAARAGALGDEVFRRARDAGALRPDFEAADVPMLFEQITAIRLGDPARTAALRGRYLTLLLDAVRATAATGALPSTPPTSAELAARWRPAATEN
ncbi:helix-turn-helix domain-containing protein [Actinoplanes sp. NPDC051411]|uniref:TetR/AcrR family transcriptional regulator n=1 Tax=Actinoplanes sp. NPDC051411 TaxID=3155522 RepID=UPI003432FCED